MQKFITFRKDGKSCTFPIQNILAILCGHDEFDVFTIITTKQQKNIMIMSQIKSIINILKIMMILF